MIWVMVSSFALHIRHLPSYREIEYIEKYQDLKREVQKLWNMKVKTIPIVIGALGTIPKTLHKQLEQIETNIAFEQMQTTVLLNTARTLRKVLEI